MKAAASLRVAIQPSRRLLFIELAAHLFAAGVVLVASLPPGLIVTLLLLSGTSLIYMRRRWLVQGGELILHSDGRLEKVGSGDTADELVLHPHTTVLPLLVVLLYRQDGRVRSLTLLSDSFAEEDFRQLRLWLRWCAAKQFAKSRP